MSQLVNKVGTRSVVGTLAGSANRLRHHENSQGNYCYEQLVRLNLGICKVAQKINLCISCNFSEHNSGSFNEKVNAFVDIFADRLYPQVTFGMLLCARKPSTSVTVVSHLIKYDYSVIELQKNRCIFCLKRPHKRDQPECYRCKYKGSASTIHINFEDINRKNLDHKFQSSSMCYVVITFKRHTSDFKRPCFASTTIAGKETSYSGLLSKWLVLMLSHHLTINNVQM